MENIVKSTYGYSRLLAVEIYNFMTIEHAKLDFDESNILNIKGYNDSGKSAIERMLDILFFNIRPKQQSMFIQKGKDYFRGILYFSDCIYIRDKYINGQSLYEIYDLERNCIFSTKVNGMLMKDQGIPEKVKEYLGVLYFGKTPLNTRSCFQPQIIVETTGAENHEGLNVILKSEEISKANELINIDRNKIGADALSVTSQITNKKEDLLAIPYISNSMLIELEDLDKKIDLSTSKSALLHPIENIIKKISEIPRIPELTPIANSKLNELANISLTLSKLEEIRVAPKVSRLDNTRLNALEGIKSVLSRLDEYSNRVAPILDSVEISRISSLSEIMRILGAVSNIANDIKSKDAMLESLNSQLTVMNEELITIGETDGRKYVTCKNCGTLVEVGDTE